MSAGGEIIEGLVKVVFRQGAKRIGKMVTGAIGKKLSKDEAKEALEKIAEQKLAKATRKAKGKGKQWSSDSGFYETGYRAQLLKGHYPGVSDAKHFQEANKQLHNTFQVNPKFAQQMEKLYPGIINGVKPGARGAFPRNPPTKDLTWHHNAYDEGAMDLVPFGQHTERGKVQNALHPNNKGGMENWGGGRKRKKL